MTQRTSKFTTLLIALSSTFLMYVRLFWPNPIGMADNGDGSRLMCQVGVAPLQSNRVDLYFNWAIFRYYASAYRSNPGVHGSTPPSSCGHYPGVVLIVYKFNIWISKLLGLHATLNLEIDMVLYALLVGVLTYALVRLFALSILGDVLIGLGLLLIAGDSIFAGYPGSPYAGVTGIAGLLIMMVALVYFLRDGGFSARALGLVAFTIGSIALVGTMIETVTFALPIIIYLLWMTVRPARHTFSLYESIGLRVLSLLGAVAVGYAAVHTYAGDPKSFQRINPTEAITGDILGGAAHPRADLHAMGLPTAFARFAGTSWWGANPIESTKLFARYQSKFSYMTAAKFYLTHPLAVLRVANYGATHLMQARPLYAGSFQQGIEPARSLEHRLPFIGNLMSDFKSLGIFIVVIMVVGSAAVAIHFLRTHKVGTQTHAYASLALLMNSLFVIGFATATFGESFETTKHLVFTVMAGILCGFSIILAMVSYYKIDRHRKPKTIDEPGIKPPTGLVEILS